MQGVTTPHPPWDDLRFSNTTGILPKKTMWFIGVEVEQETGAPYPLLKKILDLPLHTPQLPISRRWDWESPDSSWKPIFCLCWQHLLPACIRLLFTDVCTQATASKEFIPLTHEIKNDWKWDFPLAYQKFLGSLSMYRLSLHNFSFQVQTVTHWENIWNILCKETITWSTVFLCGIGYIHFIFVAQWFSKEPAPKD